MASRLLLLAVLLLAAALRWHEIGDKSLWLDEIAQLLVAQEGLAGLIDRLRVHSGAPADYLLSMLALTLGRQEAWLRFTASLFSILTLPALYQLGRRLLGETSALLAVTLLAVSPFAVRYGQELRPYAAFGFWSALSTLLLVRAMQRKGGWMWLAYGLAGLVNLHTHLFAVAAVAVQGLWLAFTALGSLVFRGNQETEAWAWHWPRSRWLWASAVIIVLALAFLFSPWLPDFVADVVGEFAGLSEGVAQDGSGQEALQTGALSEVTLDLLRYTTGQVSAGGDRWTNGLYLLLAFLGVLFGLRRRPASTLLLLLLALVGPLLILLILTSRGARFNPRYLIFAHPAYLLLIGQGLAGLGGLASALTRHPRAKHGVATAVAWGGGLLLLAATWAGLSDQYARRQEDWRGVASFLQEFMQPGDTFGAGRSLVNYLSFYTPEIRLQERSLKGLEDLQEIRSSRLWLLDTPYDATLREPDAQAWLAAQGAVTLDFPPTFSLFYVNRNADPLEEIQAWVSSGRLAEDRNRDRYLLSAFFERSEQLLAAGDGAGAAEAAAVVADLAPRVFTTPLEFLSVADLLAATGSVEAAIPWYENVVKSRPNLAEARLKLGAAYVAMGQGLKAEAQAQIVLSREPRNYDGYLLMGRSELARQRPQAALEAYMAAMALDSTRPEAYLLRSAVHRDLGDEAAAAEVLRQGLNAIPGNAELAAAWSSLVTGD